jgi:hypothetical protein
LLSDKKGNLRGVSLKFDEKSFFSWSKNCAAAAGALVQKLSGTSTFYTG